MTTAFSAGPQALGYLFQARYALYALLIERREEASVIIEGLDDIEIRAAGNSVSLDQLKHHIRREATLTNASPDLWKTIRIWSTSLSQGLWDPDTVRLNLITTATAPECSAAWRLRAPFASRGIDQALDLLLATIRDSRTTSESVRSAFESFQQLSASDQRRLLRAITVIDCAPNVEDLPKLIRAELVFAAPPSGRTLDRLCEQVEGWWFRKVADHLYSGSREPIERAELQRKIWTITAQFTEESLPIDYADAEPTWLIDPQNDARVFVRQLRVLNINARRIHRAILDYYRAFEQRGRWVRDQLLIDDDIARYERRLVDEWEVIKLAIEDARPSPPGTEEACIALGHEIYDWMETKADFKVRPHVDDRFVTRGSYHILADTETPRVFWHPKFLERLEQILSR